MKDVLISQFIDDELRLDEKIAFVQEVHRSPAFAEEALDLLRQEQLLAAEVTQRVPQVRLPAPRSRAGALWRYLGVAASAAAAAVLVLLLWPAAPQPAAARKAHRFVLYQPQAERVEIVGDFTGWRKVPLERSAGPGYWEITLELPPGEHRFSYIVGGRHSLPDPTVRLREADDFGNQNSVLEVRL